MVQLAYWGCLIASSLYLICMNLFLSVSDCLIDRLPIYIKEFSINIAITVSAAMTLSYSLDMNKVKRQLFK